MFWAEALPGTGEEWKFIAYFSVFKHKVRCIFDLGNLPVQEDTQLAICYFTVYMWPRNAGSAQVCFIDSKYTSSMR